MLLLDVFDDFEHEDGEELAASFRERLPALRRLVDDARHRNLPLVYANDRHGHWHGDLGRFLAELGMSPRELMPRPEDAFLFKDHYSAFDHTALEVLLRELETERIVLAGMTLEGCVTQTAIDARERGLKVSVVEPACARIDDDAADAAVAYLLRVAGARVVSELPDAPVTSSPSA